MGAGSLDTWIRRLNREDMPIFARTAQIITGITSRDSSSFSEMARGILQDASLTSRVLKLSNSVYYNPGRSSISTISRAVMLLGFDTVYGMCLSYSLVEETLKGTHRQRVIEEMTRSFHAAVQAKAFAIARKDKSPEEVFIAALLYRLGYIAFWCFAKDAADKLEAAMKEPGLTPAQAEQKVLGFRLQQLTKELGRGWNLGSLLDTALDAGIRATPRVSMIHLGHTLASTVEEHGWSDRKTAKVMARIAEFLNMPLEATVKIVHMAAKDAVRVAANYGVPKSSRIIPMPSDEPEPAVELESEEEPMEEEGAGTEVVFEFPEPNRTIQLQVLHELSSLLLEPRIDINFLFSALMEGIFRGVGMDRVLFALLTRDRSQLRGRSGLGWTKESTVRDFSAPTKPLSPNIFSYAMETHEPLWITDNPHPSIARLLTPEVRSLSDSAPFFIMSLSPRGQSIGFIYADRQPSERELDEESFTSFTFFGRQANLCLSTISK